MIRHAPHYLIVVASLSLAACDEPTNATRPVIARPQINGPSFTLGSGVTNTIPTASANAGEFHVHSTYKGFNVELTVNDNTDVSMGGSTTILPGGNNGWHAHPGLVIVVVKAGALTFYEANDPSCTPTIHPAGTVIFETGGDVHIARNEGSVNAEFTATQFVPAGSPRRIDAAAPGNCPF